MFVENFSGPGREEFFESELAFLCGKFERVTLVPLYEQTHPLNVSFPNLRIEKINAFAPCNRIKVVLSRLGFILRVYFFELGRTHHKAHYVRNVRHHLNNLILKVAAADALHLRLKHHYADTVFYSYWFSQWAFILSLVKARNPRLKLATRAHGSDYKEEQTGTVLAFRYFQLSVIDRILPVSDYAKNYLMKKFKVPSAKITVGHLGLAEVTTLSPIDPEKLTLVSCSSLIPLKRVHLIPEVLRLISQPVTWYHFGDGPGREELKQKVASLPAHVQVRLMGYVPNPTFLQFLSITPTSFFMNVSENEGIPVTLMEASRLGIPLIGTDTCGIPEIVTEETGFLVPVAFRPEHLAELIVTEHQKGTIYTEKFRAGVTGGYTRGFSAGRNYTELADTLYNLN